MLHLTLSELEHLLGSRARAVRVRKWLYSSRPAPQELPSGIAGVRPSAWDALRSSAPLPAYAIAKRQFAPDGTLKLAISLGDTSVETVLIPGERRSTVCVSSQAGCTRRCSFCATATLGFRRSLSAGEIILQYLVAQAEACAERPARNVVFMGMGEPLDNLEAVLAAIGLLTENPLPGLAAEHVTLSTSGVLPALARFLELGRGQLALSLNATTDAVRQRLIPHNRSWSIEALLQALRADARLRPGRRYFIEYVLIRGVNDSDEDARRLLALLAGLPAHVNLILFNPTPDSEYAASSPERARAFQQQLQAAGLRALLRPARGADIAAACGQLALA